MLFSRKDSSDSENHVQGVEVDIYYSILSVVLQFNREVVEIKARKRAQGRDKFWRN